MAYLHRLIEKGSERLHKNSLCQWILGEEAKYLPPEEVLSFAPAMLFFILGFRDILQTLEFPDPRHEYEFMVNRHCLEDKDHWRWYLADLETLGFTEQNWGAHFAAQVETVWSDQNRPTRDLVYICIQLIRRFRSAKASLVIIECLEATFGVFMTTLRRRFWNSPAYSKLQFFGQIHQDQEMNHGLGHWIESDQPVDESDHKNILKQLKFSSEEEAELSVAIQLIFEQFETVFESWLAARDQFVTTELNKKYQLELSDSNSHF